WRLHIVRRKQTIANDWNSWGPAEIVISPGSIAGGYGQVFGVGEPTLTQWGDISFSVVYGDTTSTDTTDVFDSDPWFLPKKGSPAALRQHGLVNHLKIYPNPAKDKITIEKQNGNFKKASLELYNSLGQSVRYIENISSGNIIIERDDLKKGVYFYTIKEGSRLVASGKLLFE
ncbi:MAG: T9SS C-terminal target domain-containing protein, partial [Bacteroidetes bacterium]